MTGNQEITIPAPYHRWLKNEDPYFDTKRKPDYCLACGVVRHPLADWASDLAAGPCPERPWKQVWAEEIAATAAAEHEAKIRKDMGR